jgi:hypothetical protein
MELAALFLKIFIFTITLFAVAREVLKHTQKSSPKSSDEKTGINLAQGHRHISSYGLDSGNAQKPINAPIAKVISLADRRRRVS